MDKIATDEIREWDPNWQCWAWRLNGKIHRKEGPAIEDGARSKYWFQNDELHREDGPAITWGHGCKEWWLNGERFSETEWCQKVKALNGGTAVREIKNKTTQAERNQRAGGGAENTIFMGLAILGISFVVVMVIIVVYGC